MLRIATIADYTYISSRDSNDKVPPVDLELCGKKKKKSIMSMKIVHDYDCS